MKKNMLKYFNELYSELNKFDDILVEDNFIIYFLGDMNKNLNKYIYQNNNIEIQHILKTYNFPFNIEILIDFFEFYLDANKKNTHGIVFTPKYISDYMVNITLQEIKSYDSSIKIIDPSCGCGIFLISSIEFLKNEFNIKVSDIIQNNLIGLDIIDENIRRLKKILHLYSILNNDMVTLENINVKDCDSLDKTKCWTKNNNTNYIIGNPPYVNTHDMNKNTVNYLKENYTTTQEGSFNIFYAFIEKSISELDDNGSICFIIPNNFFSIKSAKKLREYLQLNQYISELIDFKDNLLFKNIRTYNCIIKLKKTSKNKFIKYKEIKKTTNVILDLNELNYSKIEYKNMSVDSWRFVDYTTLKNLNSIESHSFKLKEYIKTGIATLKDAAYMVEHKNDEFYIINNNIKYIIDKELVRDIYKIPELKKVKDHNDTVKYIIFPYKIHSNIYKIIDEDLLKNKYSLTYNYLLSIKEILASRDKGKKSANKWYAYGRSQGIQNYGEKILFPTFSNKPKFIHIKNKNALFCNGYAMFENDFLKLDIIVKILNSSIMDYYIKNTSYSIEGGFYCFQKKYIEKFSIPNFSTEELLFLENETRQKNINIFLEKKYNINISNTSNKK